MTSTAPSARLPNDFSNSKVAGRGRLPYDVGRPQRKTPLMRMYEVVYLTSNGTEAERTLRAPANPLFENAFNAFARGTLVQTEHGPTAIEDLYPGQLITTLEYGPLPLLWRGSMKHSPDQMAPGSSPTITRSTTGAMGLDRPLSDVLLGPGARLLQKHRAVQDTMADSVYIPATDFENGDSIFPMTPQVPMTFYHLVLQRHATILAGGIGVETYHPGPGMLYRLGPVMIALYLDLFPPMKSLNGFGAMAHPRATMDDLHAATA